MGAWGGDGWSARNPVPVEGATYLVKFDWTGNDPQPEPIGIQFAREAMGNSAAVLRWKRRRIRRWKMKWILPGTFLMGVRKVKKDVTLTNYSTRSR